LRYKPRGFKSMSKKSMLLKAFELTTKRDEEMRLKQLAMLAQDDEKIKAELNNKNS